MAGILEVQNTRKNKNGRSYAEYTAARDIIAPQQPYPDTPEHQASEQSYWIWYIQIQKRAYNISRINLVLAIVIAGGAIFTYFATQEQLNALRDEQRAWIKITVTSGRFIWTPANAQDVAFATFMPDVNLTDVGRNPAFNINTSMRATADDTPDLLIRQRAECGASDNPTLEGNTGRTLFPGDSTNASEEGVGKTFPFVEVKNRPSIRLIIYGCSSYKLTTGGEDHHTFYMFQVWRTYKLPGLPDQQVPDFTLGVAENAENIRLVPVYRGNYAD